jgi:hypothetical protein
VRAAARLPLLLLAALHAAAASLPCPPRPGAGAGRDALAAHGSLAVHATHHAPVPDGARGGAADDLRAPCPCRCEEGGPGGLAARLGPLARANAGPPAPAAGPPAIPAAGAPPASALPSLPEPVPRLA